MDSHLGAETIVQSSEENLISILKLSHRFGLPMKCVLSCFQTKLEKNELNFICRDRAQMIH